MRACGAATHRPATATRPPPLPAHHHYPSAAATRPPPLPVRHRYPPVPVASAAAGTLAARTPVKITKIFVFRPSLLSAHDWYGGPARAYRFRKISAPPLKPVCNPRTTLYLSTPQPRNVMGFFFPFSFSSTLFCCLRLPAANTQR